MTLASHSSIEQNAKEPWMVRLNEFVQVLQKHVLILFYFIYLIIILKSYIQHFCRTIHITLSTSSTLYP
jgi:hypothetical protein